ncbi:MAG: YihY/virulence factor BrkB family protein [Myxococcales bacterium]|nr:YihY/virulence factor BrkB family protein [Myxococcales bacterium]
MTGTNGLSTTVASGALALPARSLRFAARVLREFSLRKGPLMAAALAYNALLSSTPLVVVVAILAAFWLDVDTMVDAVSESLGQLVVSQRVDSVQSALRQLLEQPEAHGVVALAGLLFFSSAGFRVLQTAIDAIFDHRHLQHGPRPAWRATLIALAFVAAVTSALLLEVLALARLPDLPSQSLLELGGFAVITLTLAAAYRFMPVGGVAPGPALLGAVCAAGLWEITRRLLRWYFASVSPVNAIYGSIGSVVVVLLSLEVAASIALLGAQIIAELERSRLAELAWHQEPPAASTGTARSSRPSSMP